MSGTTGIAQGLQAALGNGESASVGELGGAFERLLGPGQAWRLTGHERLASEVHRLRTRSDSEERSFVVKRLDPAVARRVQLVARRWLPGVGLGWGGPPLLAVAAGRDGGPVWHVYEDLGDRALDERAPDRGRVEAVVDLVARVHGRFAGHPWLAECRLWGGDRGIHFFGSSLRDAIRGLQALRPPSVDPDDEREALRDRLIQRLQALLEEEQERARWVTEAGGPETLLHGDLWPKNAVVQADGDQPRARLIDWDRAGVGPVTYDLSTFLSRFPPVDRPWILDLYREAIGDLGWSLPPTAELNRLFDTAEVSRLANSIIWRASAVLEGEPEWGFAALAEFAGWLEEREPVLAEEGPS